MEQLSQEPATIEARKPQLDSNTTEDSTCWTKTQCKQINNKKIFLNVLKFTECS